MEKIKRKPIRLFFLIGAIVFLLSFLIVLPIYKNATMTAEEHMMQGLKDLKENKFVSAQSHLRKVAQNQNAEAFFILGNMEMEAQNTKEI